MIGVARQALGRDAETKSLTAADSTAGGLQAHAYNVDEEVSATVRASTNPGREADDQDPETPGVPQNPLDGRYGRDPAPSDPVR